ncbi:MAG: hypothetical protein AB2401_00595 [Bacillus sp. (in: firmicutes)]
MFKKKVGTLIAVSALVAGFGLANGAAAAQTDNSSISQNQSAPSNFYQNKNTIGNYSWNWVSGAKGAGQAQASTTAGSQTQNGDTSGAETVSQSQVTTVDVQDDLNGNPQKTQATGSLSDSVTTTGPAKVTQQQKSISTTLHFQGTIKGGPTLQNAMTQFHSHQYSSAISK